jgi:hypothetical protein
VPGPADSLHLLSVAEYAELGETEHGYTELRSYLPDKYEVQLELDVDLGLAEPGRPGFSRRPDLIVVDRAARERVREFGGLFRASEVLVVVEIVSPGSKRTDEEFGYRDLQVTTGTFRTETPFDAEIDLDRLR